MDKTLLGALFEPLKGIHDKLAEIIDRLSKLTEQKESLIKKGIYEVYEFEIEDTKVHVLNCPRSKDNKRLKWFWTEVENETDKTILIGINCGSENAQRLESNTARDKKIEVDMGAPLIDYITYQAVTKPTDATKTITIRCIR